MGTSQAPMTWTGDCSKRLKFSSAPSDAEVISWSKFRFDAEFETTDGQNLRNIFNLIKNKISIK
jgi:hypothetical protein